jgi:mono/diheme cytochrome c family protein
MRGPRAVVVVAAVLAPCLLNAAGSPPPDPAAALYLEQCAACHSVTGEPSDSVDLLAASQQPAEDLAEAVRRMQDNVGPLTDEQVAAFVALLKAPDLRSRIESAAAAPPAPPGPAASPERGERLFFGQELLANGGAACSACHAVNGEGGTLARDLTAVRQRIAGPGLVTVIERAPFPLMKQHYAAKPVSTPEAADLAAFLEATEQLPLRRAATPPMLIGATGGTVALVLAGTALVHRRRRAGTRSRLVRKSSRRS